MLVAGFVDGHLIYIFGFSFNEQSFTSRLREQLEKDFPDGDETNKFLRSAGFVFKYYKDAESLKIIYTASRQDLFKAQPYITKEVFKHLEKTT